MARTEEYEIISASTASELSQLVNEKLAIGWKPYKQPFADQGKLYQAVVIAKKTEKRLRKTSGDGLVE